MMQTIAREMNIPIGTQIGLYGDYNAPSAWGEILGVKVASYVKVDWPERIIGRCFDTGLLALREEATVIRGFEHVYIGKTLLLLHRYPDAHWDYSDPVVHVYGVPDEFDAQGAMNITSLANYDDWHGKLEWLSAAANIFVLEDGKMSEFARVVMKRASIV
jgi:hypothetical protein